MEASLGHGCANVGQHSCHPQARILGDTTVAGREDTLKHLGFYAVMRSYSAQQLPQLQNGHDK